MARPRKYQELNKSPKPRLNTILEERNKTNGNFLEQSACSQELLKIIANYSEVNEIFELTPFMLESIIMICHKLSRIAVGDPRVEDHWDDIAGYATLTANEIRNGKD